MDLRHAVYHNLVTLASSDGEVTSTERRALTRYRRALRLPKDAFQVSRRRGMIPTDDIDGCTGSECEHVFRMLARVAWSDGVLKAPEQRRLEAVATSLDIGPIEAAEILVEAQQRYEHRRRQRRWLMGVGSAALVALVLAIVLPGRGADDQDAQQRLDELSSIVLDLEADVAREHARRVRATWVLEGRETFKDIEREYHDSVLLLVVEYELVRGTQRVRRRGTGTGFFVSEDGLVATNKHVLKPWLFSANLVKLLDEGWQLDESRVRRGAWTAGTRALRNGRIDWATARWQTGRGFFIAAAAPDTWVNERRRLSRGGTHLGRYHAHDDNDLAVVRLSMKDKVKAFALREDLSRVEKLDPVMVLGFPTGTTILEGGIAESSASVGEIRKVQDTIWVTAPIVPGNSGGPLVDVDGRVIGVATRIVGEETVGCCLPARLLRPLL